MRLALTFILLAVLPFTLHAEDPGRPYLPDTEGRYRLEIRPSRTDVVVGTSLPTTFCLSTTRGDPVDVCLGWMQGHAAWAGRYGQTTFTLLPEERGSCVCTEVVTLAPDRPYCWPMTYNATGLGAKSVDLSAFVTVLEGVHEVDASVPTCIDVKSNVVKLTVGQETSDEEPGEERLPESLREIRWPD